jgi:LEA14-like dessication related protein
MSHKLSGLGGRAFVTLLPFLFASCSVLSNVNFERPTTELESIELTGLGISGGSMNLLLDVYNPNSYELRAMRIEAGIELEGTHFGDVRLERDISLPPSEHTVVKIPVSFTWAGVGAGARGMLRRGAVDYTLDSRILVDTPMGDQTVEFRNSGLVPLKDIFE